MKVREAHQNRIVKASSDQTRSLLSKVDTAEDVAHSQNERLDNGSHDVEGGFAPNESMMVLPISLVSAYALECRLTGCDCIRFVVAAKQDRTW